MIPMILCHSSNYTKGRAQKVQYIVLHYTANNGDTARNNCNYFAGAGRNASAHYFVDENEVVQSVHEADTAWHCGAKYPKHAYCRNSNSVGIEMCSRKDANGNYYIKPETVARAVELTRALMVYYNIPQSRVLRHYDVTGKHCPAPWVRDESQWRAFLEALMKKEEEKKVTYDEFKAFMIRYEGEKAAQPVSDWAAENWESVKRSGMMDGTRPQSDVTRQELATVLHRLEGK